MVYWIAKPEIGTFGPITLRWYGVFWGIALALGYRLTLKAYRAEGRPPRDLEKAFAYFLFGAIAGARLGHCLIYEPGTYLREPWRILAIWEGGLASHGGVAGVAIALWVYSRTYTQYSFKWLLDRSTISMSCAAGFIRLGNLFNSEVIGRASDVPWAFVFTRVDRVPRHPAQLYEAIAGGLSCLLIQRLYWRYKWGERPLALFGALLAVGFSARFALEFFKEKQSEVEAWLPLGLNLGHWLSVPLMIIGAWMIFNAFSKPPESVAHSLDRSVPNSRTPA